MADGNMDWAALAERVRDWALPLAGGIPAALAGWAFGRRKVSAEASKTEAEAEAVESDAMLRRFKALIDGYEARIADLTAEVHSLRDEVKALRQALDQRTREDAERVARLSGLAGGRGRVTPPPD